MAVAKGMLPIGSASIIDRLIETGKRISKDVFLVADFPSAFKELSIRILEDRTRGAGPLGGLYTALMHAKHPYCFILSSDLPFLTKDFLISLANYTKGQPSAIVPFDRKLHPLCALYRKDCSWAAVDCIERRAFSLKSFVSCLDRVKIVRKVPRNCLYNVNTWMEYFDARSIGERKAS